LRDESATIAIVPDNSKKPDRRLGKVASQPPMSPPKDADMTQNTRNKVFQRMKECRSQKTTDNRKIPSRRDGEALNSIRKSR
jgi:hypothetical protein